MSGLLTERAKNILLNGVGEGMLESEDPFERGENKAYLKYDALGIESAQDAIGGINVVFMWRGKAFMKLRKEGVGLKNDETLVITGVEGRCELFLEKG